MFEEFGKIPRLSRECVVTEKIDGTNAQVFIVAGSDAPEAVTLPSEFAPFVIAASGGMLMFAGSRTRLIAPQVDNYGFAAWVTAHADELWALGPGRHFGEWWGSGIQRGYGLPKGEKRFSLFNTSRWNTETAPACCHVVPVLYRGVFSTEVVGTQIERLRVMGSVAAPGFMSAEGVIVYHVAANSYFKKTLDKDSEPKGRAA